MRRNKQSMKDSLRMLRVRLFGKEEITYGEIPILHGRNTITKAMKLLLILLHSGEKGITRNKLLVNLYGREEALDAANNLRVLVHRLRKSLIEAGLPEYDYIDIEKGIYRWKSPMPVWIDALEMEKLIESANRESDEKNRIEMLEKACRMYAGSFLQSISGDEWVIFEALRYKNIYSEVLRNVCEWKMCHGEYEEVIELCELARDMYPFDEWQTMIIECYIAMNRYKEALREYEKTAKMLVEELGVAPSEKMLEQFRMMSSYISDRPKEIREIKSSLQEETWERGAFFCTVPGFRDAYRVICRCMERNGQSVFLLVCTITDHLGRPMESSEKLEQMSETLYDAIKNSLRRSDSFTKYNHSQYLVMLIGTNEEDCQIVIDRIVHNFSKEHKSWEQNLDCSVASLYDCSPENMMENIRFGDKI